MEPPGVSLSPRSFLRRVSIVATLPVVAACQAPAATSTPAATAGSAASPPRPTAAASTAPSVGRGGLFHVVGDEPVISRSSFPDRGAVLPAAIMLDAEGRYHAWVVAFGEPPGTQEIHYLTSADAVSWSEVADASLPALSEGLGNPGALPTSVLETADGWAMYIVGQPVAEPDSWEIWRATAPEAAGPWMRSEEPVLRRGPAGAWDSGGLDFPTVIATDEGFTAFYSGIPSTQRETGSIGMATSTDGLAWTKHDDPETTDDAFAESDPVAGPGLCGGFDDRATHQPRVVALPDGLVMVYAGYAGTLNARPGVGLADSRDGGLTWGCEWPANALDISEFRAGDGVHTINAFLRGDRLSLLVEWLMADGTDVWLAHLGPRG